MFLIDVTRIVTFDSHAKSKFQKFNTLMEVITLENSMLIRRQNCASSSRYHELVLSLKDYMPYFNHIILFSLCLHIKIHWFNYKDYLWTSFNSESIFKDLILKITIHTDFFSIRISTKNHIIYIKGHATLFEKQNNWAQQRTS